jgi:DNA replication and repair protein RecF
MITPGDLYLINEYSDERRKFVDSIIAQYDPKYLEILIQYNRVLSQRNALLKSAQKTTFLDMDLIQVLDQQLESFGKGIYKGRKEFIERFLPILSEVYKEISGGKEEITCLYTCQLEEHDLRMLLAKDLDKDKIMGRTHSGIHKDDFVFLMNELPVKKYGSQGQQKSFVFALKLAQTRIIFEQSGQFPIILLDDVFDRLDQERMKNLMSYLFEQSFGHLFLSDTESERVVNILKDYQMDYELISIDNGNLAVDENKKKD